MSDVTTKLDEYIRASEKNCRVDVVKLAKSLGLEVFSIEMPDNTNGYINYDKDNKAASIEVNRNHPITRQRFTIAHEISHFVKHQHVLEKKGKLDRSSEYKDEIEKQMEIEADKEAAKILMPDYVVERYLEKKKWSSNTKFDSSMIQEIADTFWVSKAMAITRLRELEFPIPYLSFA